MREIKRATLICILGLTIGGCLAEESDPEDGPASSAEVSEPLLLSSCRRDRDCGRDMMCLIDITGGTCACAPGLVACGRRCVDVANDDRNCGACGESCGGEVPCIDGLCGGLLPEPLFTSGTPTLVSVNSSGVPDDDFEPFVERSASAGTAVLFGTYSRRLLNTATAWNSWGTTSDCTVPLRSGFQQLGDTWAATSGGTGLNYVSAVIQSDAGARFSGIAAATPTQMAACSFPYPLTPITPSAPPGLTDGTKMHFDPGDVRLFLTDITAFGGSLTLYSMYPCNVGQPGNYAGSTGCPIRATVPKEAGQNYVGNLIAA